MFLPEEVRKRNREREMKMKMKEEALPASLSSLPKKARVTSSREEALLDFHRSCDTWPSESSLSAPHSDATAFSDWSNNPSPEPRQTQEFYVGIQSGSEFGSNKVVMRTSLDMVEMFRQSIELESKPIPYNTDSEREALGSNRKNESDGEGNSMRHSPERAIPSRPRFLFATEFFEKRLQERMHRMQEDQFEPRQGKSRRVSEAEKCGSSTQNQNAHCSENNETKHHHHRNNNGKFAESSEGTQSSSRILPPTVNQERELSQKEEMKEKIEALQDVINRLKESIEDEGKKWRNKMKELEITGLHHEVKEMLNELKSGFKSKGGSLIGLGKYREDDDIYTMQLDALKKQVDALEGRSANLEDSIKAEINTLLTGATKGLSNRFRKDMHLLEIDISRDLDTIRKEMDSRFAKLWEETEWHRKAEMQHIEALIEERVDRRLSLQSDNVVTDLRKEVGILWAEVDTLSKGQYGMKEHVDCLARIAEMAKEHINKEQSVLKAENGALKKQLQYLKKECMRTRADAEDLRKEVELNTESLKLSTGNLEEETAAMKESLGRLKGFEEKVDLRRVIGILNQKAEIRQEELKAFEFKLEKANRERLENLSSVYLGAVQEVRGDVVSLKQACEERLGILERESEERQRREQDRNNNGGSLKELVLDALETRVSHLEGKIEERSNACEATLAIIDEERSLAAAAYACEAEDALTKAVEHFNSEMEKAMRKSAEIQESMSVKRDLATASVSEIERMSHHLTGQMESALAILSETRKKSLVIQDGLENEKSKMINSVALMDKEKEAATAKAEEVLTELVEMQREILAIQNEASDAIGLAHDNYMEEVEQEIKGWRKLMQDEVIRAQSVVDRFEEENRRASVNLSGDLTHGELENRIIKTEETTKELARQAIETSNATLNLTQEEQKMEVATLKHTIEGISVQLNTVVERDNTKEILERERHECLKKDLSELGQRVSDAALEQSSILEKVEEVWRRINKVESMQTNLVHSLERVQTSTDNLEQSTAVWLPKYETAARVLHEFETRIKTIESSINRKDDSEKQVSVEKRQAESVEEQALRLYTEMSRSIQETSNTVSQNNVCKTVAEFSESSDSLLDARMVALEGCLEHMESSIFSNLRCMESRLQQCSTSVEAALKGSMVAENKCSALGVELLKVFRILARSRSKGNSSRCSFYSGQSKGRGADDMKRSYHDSHKKTPAREIEERSLTLSSPPPLRTRSANSSPCWKDPTIHYSISPYPVGEGRNIVNGHEHEDEQEPDGGGSLEKGKKPIVVSISDHTTRVESARISSVDAKRNWAPILSARRLVKKGDTFSVIEETNPQFSTHGRRTTEEPASSAPSWLIEDSLVNYHSTDFTQATLITSFSFYLRPSISLAIVLLKP